ncbi:hypothetical protein L596_015881 [Steinernema carpocapsae]|uniref:U6 snRNA-associated Sm-like protein LSm3 n=1 Tax=Steinernema carpocapsae TaxID=34508 RepID=A0A4U5NGF4_STECR|nr:hypothetical protein L596_015881 [Steinernema carpocapsae]
MATEAPTTPPTGEGVIRSITNVYEPLDMIRLSLNERVHIKMRNDREILGQLQGFDQHLNMVLSDVEEIITTMELDEESYEEIVKQTKRNVPMLFVRGDSIILVSTLPRR